jgi:hypothetical protein
MTSLFNSIDAGLRPKTVQPIKETRVIPVVHPTQNQSAVLAKIVGAATPKIAAAEISDNANLAAARDMLQKMGLIKLDDTGATVTDSGKEVMVNHNLADSSGGLTPDGQKLANNGKEGPPQPPGGDFDMDLGGGDTGGDLGGLDLGGSGEGGDLDMELDLGDDMGDGDLEGESDAESEDDEPDMQAQEQGAEDNGQRMESFKLLPGIRQQAIVESLEKVPEDLLSTLSPEEVVSLRRALDGEQNFSDDEGLWHKLYNYFVSEMPYGTAKARTGDPEEWMVNRLA